jgi:hypothetical protein
MALKLDSVKIEKGYEAYHFILWADKGLILKLFEVEGVHDVSNTGTRYSIWIDHRYNPQSVMDYIKSMLKVEEDAW